MKINPYECGSALKINTCSTKNTEESYKKKGFSKSKQMHKGERIIKQSGLERRDMMSEIKSGTFK